MAGFKKLFEPLQLGPLTLRNRIAMCPTNENMARADGTASELQVSYWATRAKGGAGLVIAGNAAVDNKLARITSTQLTLHSDVVIPPLRNMTEGIHMYGAKAIMEIVHAGRQSMSAVTGAQPVAPSPVPARNREMPRELTVPEIKDIVKIFADAAARVKRADFDGVEIHCAYQYLLSQFISPNTNKRTDEYGGDIKGRMRLPLEVVEAVRKRVGDNYVVGVRFCAHDYAKGGVTPEIAKEAAKLFEKAGVDYLAVGSGSASESVYMTEQPTYIDRGQTSYLAGEIKSVVKVPVLISGSLDEEIGEGLLERGEADIIGMARPLIADPYFPTKLKEGRREDIRRCIRCDECIGRILNFGHVRCTVNPDCGNEDHVRNKYELVRAERPKSVLVVGGGPGGMEAAIVAAQRGHRVALYEKTDRLGGNLNLAAIPSFKKDIALFKEYLVGQLKKLGVNVKLGTEVTAMVVKDLKPDTIIIAIGADPIVPKVPGIDGKKVFIAEDALQQDERLGKKIAVVGGGLIGCEVALHLGQKGRKVTLVEELDEIAHDINRVSQGCLLDLLPQKGVEIRTGERFEEVTPEGIVVIDKTSKRQSLVADSVVIAVGYQARRHVVESLADLVPETYVVGDALDAGKIYQAVHQGFHVARQI